MSVIDYKGDKEYPPPEERHTKLDFPSVDELYVYGVDIPVPKSMDELKCKYNEKEPTPLLKLEELNGYKVPPLGIVLVGVNGTGLRAGAANLIYPPGTFREDRHTINKELGVTPIELNLAREQKKKEAMVESVAGFMQQKGKLPLENIPDDPNVLAACVVWALELIDESSSPKEALNFLKWFEDKLTHKAEILAGLKKQDDAIGLASQSLDVVDKVLEYTDARMKELQGEVVESRLYDIEDGADCESPAPLEGGELD